MGTTRPAREGGSAVLLRLCVCVASSGRARRRGGGVLRVHRQRVEEGADDGHGGPREAEGRQPVPKHEQRDRDDDGALERVCDGVGHRVDDGEGAKGDLVGEVLHQTGKDEKRREPPAVHRRRGRLSESAGPGSGELEESGDGGEGEAASDREEGIHASRGEVVDRLEGALCADRVHGVGGVRGDSGDERVDRVVDVGGGEECDAAHDEQQRAVGVSLRGVGLLG
mmetsp:Transcript_1232/g.3674  ORF Transcript_1232/g.3674 Transcript_1232/m.3674 type:complete len:225 (+) Transcript_1232:797-1471(+)